MGTSFWSGEEGPQYDEGGDGPVGRAIQRGGAVISRATLPVSGAAYSAMAASHLGAGPGGVAMTAAVGAAAGLRLNRNLNVRQFFIDFPKREE